jgi:hypothetical protein
VKINTSLMKIDVAVLAGLAACTVAVWQLLLAPALSYSQRESAAAAELVVARRDNSDAARRLASVQSELLRTRHELEDFAQPIWTDNDRSRRTESLYACARQAGLNVDNVEPGDYSNPGGRRALAFRVSATASFPALTEFLASLRKAMPDFVVKSVDVVGIGPEAEQRPVNIELLWVLPASEASQGRPSGEPRRVP